MIIVVVAVTHGTQIASGWIQRQKGGRWLSVQKEVVEARCCYLNKVQSKCSRTAADARIIFLSSTFIRKCKEQQQEQERLVVIALEKVETLTHSRVFATFIKQYKSWETATICVNCNNKLPVDCCHDAYSAKGRFGNHRIEQCRLSFVLICITVCIISRPCKHN